MKIRNQAKIGTSFPYDPIVVDDEVVQQSGKAVTAAIAEIMRSFGAAVSEPIDVDEHGWELEISYKGCGPWFQVQDAGGCIWLDMKDYGGPLFGDDPRYIEFVVLLNAELHRDPRFHDIRWYRRGDINLRDPPSASPVDR